MTKQRKLLLLGLWIGYAVVIWILASPYVDFRQAFFGCQCLNGLTFLIAITALLKTK
jgi:hypothetical protein